MGLLSTLKMYARPAPKKLDAPTDLYEHKVELLEGGELDLATFRGRPTLIVNTASNCGFTGQFDGLQELYAKYHDEGLQILGCPSGDFNDQEHDEASEIGAVCRRNYGVQFPMTAKMSVRQSPDPLWADLAAQPGSKPPVWNFSKYLVGADGTLIKRWPTKTTPDDPDVVAAIEQALQTPDAGAILTR